MMNRKLTPFFAVTVLLSLSASLEASSPSPSPTPKELPFQKLPQLQQEKTITQANGKYVPIPISLTPYSTLDDHAHLEPNDAVKTLKQKLKFTDNQIMLLIAGQGWGKTTTVKKLAQKLYGTYEDQNSPIPIYIDVKESKEKLPKGKKKQDLDLITIALKNKGWKKNDITELQSTSYKPLFIIDGIDKLKINPSKYLKVKKWKNAKFLLTARVEPFVQQVNLVKRLPENSAEIEIFYLRSWNKKAIKQYIKKPEAENNKLWSALQKHGLHQASTPCILNIVKALTKEENPTILKKDWAIRFMEKWLMGLGINDPKAWEHHNQVLTDLALYMYEHGQQKAADKPLAKWTAFATKKKMRKTFSSDSFFKNKENKKLLGHTPIIWTAGDHYSFPFDELFTYFVARGLYHLIKTNSTDHLLNQKKGLLTKVLTPKKYYAIAQKDMMTIAQSINKKLARMVRKEHNVQEKLKTLRIGLNDTPKKQTKKPRQDTFTWLSYLSWAFMTVSGLQLILLGGYILWQKKKKKQKHPTTATKPKKKNHKTKR